MQGNEDLRSLASGYIEEAVSCYEEEKYEKALLLFQRAIEAYETLKDTKEICIGYSRMSVLYALNGNREMANQSNMKALGLAIQNGYSIYEVKILNNIANDMSAKKDYTRTIPILLRAAELLKLEEVKRDPEFYMVSLYIYANLTRCYIFTNNYKDAEQNLRKGWEMAAYLFDPGYDALLRLLECVIHWNRGNHDRVYTYIDEIIEYYSGENTVRDLEENIYLLTSLLMEMREYDRWRNMLEVFEEFAERQDTSYYYMVSADLWANYYESIGDNVNFQATTIEYRKYSKLHQEKLQLESAKEYDQIFQEQIVKANSQSDLLLGQKDILTQVGNEEKLRSDFQKLIAQLSGTDNNLGLLIIDIEKFARYNKSRGYLGGDELLKRIGEILKSSLTEYGMAYRISGDQFILLLTECTQERLENYTERLSGEIPVPVAQGVCFMRTNQDQTLEYYLEKAEHALSLAKKKEENKIVILETNRKDYHNFYARYFANVEEAANLEKEFFNAKNKEEWLDFLEQRRIMNYEFLEENEAMIAHYLMPLFDKTEELTEEIALALAEEIWEYRNKGYQENRLMLETAEFIEPLLEMSSHSREHIHMLIVLAESYSTLNSEIYFRKVRMYYEKLGLYKDFLPSLRQRNLRRTLYEAYLKSMIVLVSDAATPVSKLFDMLEEVEEYYIRPEITAALRYTDEEIRYITNLFIVRMISGATQYSTEVEPDNKDYNRAYEMIEDMFNRRLMEAPSVFEVDDRLIGVYRRLAWLTGRIPVEESFRLDKEFFVHYDLADVETEKSNALDSTMGYRAMVYYIPEMLVMYSRCSDEFKEQEKEFIEKLIKRYIVFMSSLPKGGRAVGLSLEVFRSFGRLVAYLPEWVDAYELIFNAFVERNIDISIHCRMVSEISKAFIDSICTHKPELLVGYFSSNHTPQDVTKNREKFKVYIKNAGLMHDIGKMEIMDILGQQNRRLTSLEFDNIKRHPYAGAKFLESVQKMNEYIPVVLGHHKSYDDKSGYPLFYFYKNNEFPVLVNIIHLADCIDAATDSIGRVYSKSKSYVELIDEFVQGKGTQYNSDLIELMQEDTVLQETIQKLITKGREDINFEVYTRLYRE